MLRDSLITYTDIYIKGERERERERERAFKGAHQRNLHVLQTYRQEHGGIDYRGEGCRLRPCLARVLGHADRRQAKCEG
jgi:hypothetical protein